MRSALTACRYNTQKYACRQCILGPQRNLSFADSVTTTTYNPYHNCKYRRGYELFKWNGFCTGPFQLDIYIIYLTFIFSLFSARAD